MIVGQAHILATIDTESEPEEAPSETEEFQPLAARTEPPSSDHTPISFDSTPVSPLIDEEFEASEPSDTKITSPHFTSPSDPTTPLSSSHLLTQKTPAPMFSRPLYYRRTTRMVVRTQPAMSPGLSARVTEAMTLSPLSFRKRYRSPYDMPSPSSSLTLPIQKTYREEEGPGSEEEEAAPEGQQQAVPVVDTAADEPLGLGYVALRRCELALGEGSMPSTFEIGQSSRSMLE
ncbi:hypothetical protein Tco_0958177 [Tanacetum coccineum]